jgi:hypothetical protein
MGYRDRTAAWGVITPPTRTDTHTPGVKQKKGGSEHTHKEQKPLAHVHTPPKNIFGGDLLSHTPSGCSTISAKSLNYRVRNETGCTPLAITTEKTNHTHQPTHGAGMVKTNQTTHLKQDHTAPPVVVSKPYSEHEHTTIIYKPSQQPPNTPTRECFVYKPSAY